MKNLYEQYARKLQTKYYLEGQGGIVSLLTCHTEDHNRGVQGKLCCSEKLEDIETLYHRTLIELDYINSHNLQEENKNYLLCVYPYDFAIDFGTKSKHREL